MLPPMYLFIALASMVLLHLFMPVYQLMPYPWNAAGLLPLLLGIALNHSADKAFKSNGTTVNPFEEPTTLLTTGVFSYSRNPMYLGMVMILLGVALLLGTLSPFIIVPVFAIAMDRIFVNFEEKILARRFGDQWKIYQANVRRWL